MRTPIPLLLLALVPGCVSFHAYRPVTVQVRDAETKKPIPGASVHLWYTVRNAMAPTDSIGTTADDGTAQLRAAPFGDGGIVFDAAADGYLYEVKDLSVAAIEAIPRSHLFEDMSRRPVTLVAELYAAPRPVVELVLPPGYRGQVKAHLVAREDAACPPGQRNFSYAVRDSGEVEIDGPALLRHAVATEYRARYADGTRLGPNAKDLQVGFWPLKEEGEHQYFFVGTRGEYEELARASLPAGFTPRHSSGGGGKGRGRHGRRGGPSAADSSN